MVAPVPPALHDRDPGDEDIDAPVADFDVLCWRYDELVRAGYPTDTAIVLAERGDVDLHEARGLLERGASVDAALRILL